MVWRGSTLRGSDKETINKEYRSTTMDAVKRVDGWQKGVDDDGVNRKQ